MPPPPPFRDVPGFSLHQTPLGCRPFSIFGASLLVAAWRRRAEAEATMLAAGAAIRLTAIDAIYVTRQVLPPINLADAAVEIVLILAWGWRIAKRRRGSKRRW